MCHNPINKPDLPDERDVRSRIYKDSSQFLKFNGREREGEGREKGEEKGGKRRKRKIPK